LKNNSSAQIIAVIMTLSFMPSLIMVGAPRDPSLYNLRPRRINGTTTMYTIASGLVPINETVRKACLNNSQKNANAESMAVAYLGTYPHLRQRDVVA
jgi:hypothetical protein